MTSEDFHAFMRRLSTAMQLHLTHVVTSIFRRPVPHLNDMPKGAR